ncbi:hypothetical protein PM082_021580 [Marasmius tenuissimus]|nr:hypothetical protein PM082_021580 [Marasmius tenuissimus]
MAAINSRRTGSGIVAANFNKTLLDLEVELFNVYRHACTNGVRIARLYPLQGTFLPIEKCLWAADSRIWKLFKVNRA